MTCPDAFHFQVKPPKGSAPAIIYALAAALLPYIAAIHNDFSQSWTPRIRAATRVNRILHQLLALVARMHPQKLGASAFTKLRPQPAKPVSQPAPQPTSEPAPAPVPTPASVPLPTQSPRHPQKPRRPLSARQIAARIAFLLRELEAAAQEAGHPLPQEIRELCAQLGAAAGCQALPPDTYKPKTGLFANIMTLPPGYHRRL